MCCLKCFFWCLEKFLKFINKNAYIMCAIHGKNFCSSAKDAFLLLMRNIVRVFVLDKVSDRLLNFWFIMKLTDPSYFLQVTDFLFFLSKLLVTMGVGAVSYVVFATDLTFVDNSSLNYGIVPVIIIMISTYLISSVFFGVYSMAVDTLFLCFCEYSSFITAFWKVSGLILFVFQWKTVSETMALQKSRTSCRRIWWKFSERRTNCRSVIAVMTILDATLKIII